MAYFILFIFSFFLSSNNLYSANLTDLTEEKRKLSSCREDLSYKETQELLRFSAVAFDRYFTPENLSALKEQGEWDSFKEIFGKTGFGFIPSRFGFMASKKDLSSEHLDLVIAFRGVEMNRYWPLDLLQIHTLYIKDVFSSKRGKNDTTSELLGIKGIVPSLWLNFLDSLKEDLLTSIQHSIEKSDSSSIRITLTGNALGGALAFLAAPLIYNRFQKKYDLDFRIVTFGASASVGNTQFKENYEKLFPFYYNINIENDLVFNSALTTFASRTLNVNKVGEILTLKSISKVSGISNLLKRYWVNFKTMVCPPPSRPLIFDRPTFRFSSINVEDYLQKSVEIHQLISK